MNYILFQLFPYLAFIVMITGAAYRIKTMPYSVSAMPSQFFTNKSMGIGSNLFHIGMLGLFFGHFFGLLIPVKLLDILNISYKTKQFAAISVGGTFGVICLVGCAMLAIRRSTVKSVNLNSFTADKLILYLIIAQLVIGLATIKLSLKHPDGSEMVAFMNWASALVRFKSDAYTLVASTSIVFKIHFLLGLMTFAILPFTRLIHILKIPISYIYRPYIIIRDRYKEL